MTSDRLDEVWGLNKYSKNNVIGRSKKICAFRMAKRRQAERFPATFLSRSQLLSEPERSKVLRKPRHTGRKARSASICMRRGAESVESRAPALSRQQHVISARQPSAEGCALRKAVRRGPVRSLRKATCRSEARQKAK